MVLTEVGYLTMEPVRVLFSIRLVLPSSGCHPLLLTPCYWPASWKKGAKILGGSHFLFPILIGRGLLQRERRVSGLCLQYHASLEGQIYRFSSASKIHWDTRDAEMHRMLKYMGCWDAQDTDLHRMLRCTGCWDAWDAEMHRMLGCAGCWDTWDAEILGMLRCMECWDSWDAEMRGMLRCTAAVEANYDWCMEPPIHHSFFWSSDRWHIPDMFRTS